MLSPGVYLASVLLEIFGLVNNLVSYLFLQSKIV